MKIVVIGGTGQIGSKVVANLRAQGHEAVPASPQTGVNTLTGAAGQTAPRAAATPRARAPGPVPASPQTGVNTLTGEGLGVALAGAQVVVDVTNAPSWEDQAVLDFFTTSTRNLLAAEAETGVAHHVALSVVGAQRMTGSGYMRAKVAQEGLIASGPIPYTIVPATQFFEFVPWIAD